MKKQILLPLAIASILSSQVFAETKLEANEMNYDTLSQQNDLWAKMSEVETQKKTALTSKLENLNLQKDISAFEEVNGDGEGVPKKVELVKIYKEDNLGEKLNLNAGDFEAPEALAQQEIISEHSTISFASEGNSNLSEKDKEYEKRIKVLERQQAQFLEKMQSIADNMNQENVVTAETVQTSNPTIENQPSIESSNTSKQKSALADLSNGASGNSDFFDFSGMGDSLTDSEIRLSAKLMSVKPKSKTVYVKVYDEDTSDNSYYKVEIHNEQKEVELNLDNNVNLVLSVIKNEPRMVKLKYKDTEFTAK